MKLAALLALLIAIPGCTPPVKRSLDPVARDQEIVRDITWKFREARFSQVEVASKEGVVTLRGTVPTTTDRDDAVDIATGVVSVVKVNPELKVRSR